MTADIHAQKILILDFGSQYTQLIARRVREAVHLTEVDDGERAEVAVARLADLRELLDHVFVLDPDYRWALVAGYDHDYLWILARERQLPPTVLEDLLVRARKAGFAADGLIFPGDATRSLL